MVREQEHPPWEQGQYIPTMGAGTVHTHHGRTGTYPPW